MSHDSQSELHQHHQALGVSFGADPEELKRAYKQMVLKYHPDKNRGDADAGAMFIGIREAYEALTDPGNRVHIKFLSDTEALRQRQQHMREQSEQRMAKALQEKQQADERKKEAEENLARVKRSYEDFLAQQREEEEVAKERFVNEEKERERDERQKRKRERDNLRKREKRRQQREERERAWQDQQRKELEQEEALQYQQEHRKRRREERDRVEREQAALTQRIAVLEHDKTNLEHEKAVLEQHSADLELELDKKSDALKAIDKALECAICFERFSSTGPCTMTSCGHVVHTECHQKQQDHGTSNTCAECRAPVHSWQDFRGFTAISDAMSKLDAALGRA